MVGRSGSSAPSGTFAFLFTDIEGSTRLVESLGDAYPGVLQDHRQILRACFERWNGTEVDTQGDSFFVVFGRASDAVSCSVDAQRALGAHEWSGGASVRVRMAIHAGEALVDGGGYAGLEVHRGARIMAAAHGGQILLSQAAVALIRGKLTDGATLEDLGEHELKDFPQPERIFQLHHPELLHQFPPLVTAHSGRSNLPGQASSFIGRDKELAVIGQQLADEGVRLLTLIGPGGTGKTRLALQAASEQVQSFGDRVYFADLASATDTDAALALIARAIGVDQAREQSAFELLKHHLRDAPSLLVLDNFEQVASAAPTIAELLGACPALHLLVTSREPLHLRAEHLFPVPSLSLPPPGALIAELDLTQFEAIRLFVERARAVRPDFRLTDDNAPAVLEICRRVDGLPLAIELATARLNLFSPEALRERLGNRLSVLGGGARDLPARQQTLRATIDWSYELLEPPEQHLFEALSVFAGGRYDAIEAVVSALGPEAGLGRDALNGVASLLDKSLIRQTDSDSGPRIEMLETIREYASERLGDDPDTAVTVRRAHADHFARSAIDLDAEGTGLDELENFRAAWRFWVEQQDLDQLNRLTEPLWRAYEARGLYHATIDQATDLLDVLSIAPGSPENRGLRTELITRRLRALLAVKGYTREVEEEVASTLKLLESEEEDQTGDHLFPVLRAQASLYVFRGEFGKIREVATRIVQLGEARADGDMLAVGNLIMGEAANFAGDLRGAAEHLDQTIAWYDAHPPAHRSRQLGPHPAVIACALSAFNLWLWGHPDQAARRARMAVEVAERLEHPYSLAYAHYHAGLLHLWRQEPEVVHTHALAVLTVIREHDFAIWRALGTCLIGAAMVGLGAVAEGVVQLESGIEQYAGIRTPPIFWPLLRFMQAAAYAQLGRVAEAMAILTEAMALEGGNWPQFSLLNGELLAMGAANSRANPEQTPDFWFRRAFEMSEAIDARMPQLQAAAALRRLALSRGTDGGREELRAIYDTFTEGFETPDLVGARELLAT